LKVINDELKPKRGISMGETMEMINKHSVMPLWFRMWDNTKCLRVICQIQFDKSNVTSGGLGTMGFALPAAIGAKMGMPDREVVAIIEMEVFK
jgi:acetolactate synthase-1/2/3 large subunit